MTCMTDLSGFLEPHAELFPRHGAVLVRVDGSKYSADALGGRVQAEAGHRCRHFGKVDVP